MDEKDQVLEEKTEQELPAEGEMPERPEGFPPMGGKHSGPGMPPPPPFDGERPEKPAKPEDAPAEEAPAAE